MRSTTVAIACATLCAAWCASAARAGIVHFINPAPGQPGHFAWGQITTEDWLDITVGPGQQSNQPSGRSISQNFELSSNENVHDPAGPGALILAIPALITYTDSLLFGEPVIPLGFLREWSTWGVHSIFDPFTGLISSNFAESETRYIGVLTASGNRGWIEVVRNGMSLTARAWAYQTEPGVPITAGQVPAPGAAVLLGLGIATSRRRRS